MSPSAALNAVRCDMKMPYQEALCLLEAGNLGRARELVIRFRLEKGPLGVRLTELSGASTEPTR
jgi:hypothetical protein